MMWLLPAALWFLAGVVSAWTYAKAVIDRDHPGLSCLEAQEIIDKSRVLFEAKLARLRDEAKDATDDR